MRTRPAQAREAHVEAINTGLLLNHGLALGGSGEACLGFATRFKKGPGGGWEVGKLFTPGPNGRNGRTLGAPLFTPGGPSIGKNAGRNGATIAPHTLFKPGYDPRRTELFTAGPSGTGAKYGFTSGTDGPRSAVELWQGTTPGVLSNKYARTYFVIANWAFHCAATGEAERWDAVACRL